MIYWWINNVQIMVCVCVCVCVWCVRACVHIFVRVEIHWHVP